MTNFMPRAHSRCAWPCGQTEALVEPLADRADGAVAHDGELRANVHAGHEAVGGRAELVHALIGEAEAGYAAILRVRDAGEDGAADGSARPDLHEAVGHELRADPLIELADGEDQAALLVQKRRRPGQLEGMIFDPPPFPKTKKIIAEAQQRGAPAGADGIEQVENALLLDLRRPWESARDRARESSSECPRRA